MELLVWHQIPYVFGATQVFLFWATEYKKLERNET